MRAHSHGTGLDDIQTAIGRRHSEVTVMKHRWEFFKEHDSSFGLFYPRNYIVAGFDNLEHAEEAERVLIENGFAPDEVRAASGSFVVNQLETQDDAGFLDRLKAQLARAVGTEAGYIDDDMKLAKRGGAFVFIHTPTDDDARRVTDLLRRLHPVFARRYLPLAIERLIYPAQSAL
ncbi:hypothetical protein [Tahibacter amnicola]|uniref:Uncharacterized protein n=1 Tax=Tahibacter amnicola TaxID=2976241 RepID=A0ABY6B9Y0_9GAMM|nr:hypothetical protein [Tahibacter amnicola]UXI66873.1 hypothetical protein N4264_19250 [Tahibacter amnicola]